jgi:mono/diheme cytochrome c family protein
MKIAIPVVLVSFLLAACAGEARYNPLADYDEVGATTILDAPRPAPGSYAPEHRFVVSRGKYLVELLGCGACHTDGALEGAPNPDMALAGSHIGIAYSNPLGDDRPGIVYPPNITPDVETGIGDWSDQQISDALRAGIGRHGQRRIAVMPWQGYAKLDDEDTAAIVSYLRSIEPVHHRVPGEVAPGQKAKAPFVYLGIYRSRQAE